MMKFKEKNSLSEIASGEEDDKEIITLWRCDAYPPLKINSPK
jgi:hypothetical protein